MNFFTELRRRNVVKVASVYLVTSWLILQVIAVITPALHLPLMFSTVVTVILVIAFPLVCIFAWAFELTPEGIKSTSTVSEEDSLRRQTGNKMNYLLGIALFLALSFISYDQWYAPAAAENITPSIAVLPFEDMSPNNTQEYFGDGIAEEILNSLARLDELVVISRTSSFNFKDSSADIRQIGQTLGVNYVLEGSVRKDRDTIRITAQLVEVKSGSHIWSQTYDRTLDSIFAVQDELTYAITEALTLNLLPEQVNKEVGMTSNPSAYELFVKGRELAYARDPDSLRRAADLLHQAIALDPAFYLAQAQLYTVFVLAETYGGFDLQTTEARRERLFWSLLDAPHFPLKYLVMANHAEHNGAEAAANAMYQKAYDMAPSDPLIQNIYPLSLDDPDEAIRVRQQLITTNPENKVNYVNLFSILISEQRFEDAWELISLIEEKFDDPLSVSGLKLSITYRYQKDLRKTLSLIEQFGEDPGYVDMMYFWGAKFYLLNGNIDKSFDYLQKMLTRTPELIDYSYDVLLLATRLRENNALTSHQAQRLDQLAISEQMRTNVQVVYAMLEGSPAAYESMHNLERVESSELLSHIDTTDTEAYAYAAIKKRSGDSSVAEALLPFVKNQIMQCQYPDSNHQRCLLYMYLDPDASKQSQFARFEQSLQSLSFTIGEEVFIYSSPAYFGVHQDPRFKDAANTLLERTFRSWNPALLPAQKRSPGSPTQTSL